MENEIKKCPYCAEEIKKEAKKCRYCGEILEEIEKKNENKLNDKEIVLYEGKVHWSAYIIPWILVLFYGLGIYFIFYQKKKKIILTNRKFLYSYGLLSKKEFSINLKKIESIAIKKNILDLIFGGGSIIINGTGGNNDPIPTIDRPEELKKAIEDAISKYVI